MTDPVIFDTWFSLMRVLFVGTTAYVALILLLRVTGKRTLSKMNAFDLVVTVALGSTLAAVLLDRSIPLVDGLAGLALLVALQFIITWLSVRSAFVRGLVKAEATLLVRDGHYLDAAMRRARVTRDEVEAALRQHGIADLAEAGGVILENDGSLSVLPRD
jgi:uncharacterized membrane protein YcaP (DUF421 family)